MAVIIVVSFIGTMWNLWRPAEVVHRLEAQFDVRPDGKVAVRYELDWDFGKPGRHTFGFQIPLRDRWNGDGFRHVIYEATDLKVSSPTGAPAEFTTHGGSDTTSGALDVHVGDESVTLFRSRHTYVIEYVLSGAVYMVDGAPELKLDLTGYSFPEVKRFDAVVTGPQGVTHAVCAHRGGPCRAEVTNGRAHLEGTHVESKLVFAAALPAGSVSPPQPKLADRRAAADEPWSAEVAHEIQPDGTVASQATLRRRLAAGQEEHEAVVDIAQRRPWNDESDLILTEHDVRVRVDQGREMTVAEPWMSGKWSTRDARRTVSWKQLGRSSLMQVDYALTGGVVVDGDKATVVVPLAPAELPASWSVRLAAPAPIEEARLVVADGSSRELEVSGSTLTLSSREQLGVDGGLVRLTLPASAFGDVAPTLEPSLDTHLQRRLLTGWAGGAGVAVLIVALALLLRGPRTGGDERYVDVPPGQRGTVVGRGKPRIPARFEPPQVDLATAGLVWRRRRSSALLSAVLTQLVAVGSVRVGRTRFGRLTVERLTPPADPFLARCHAKLPSKGVVKRSHMQLIRESVQAQQEAFAPVLVQHRRRPLHWILAIALLFGVPAAAIVNLGVAQGREESLLAGNWVFVALVSLGAFIGAIILPTGRSTRLTAEGTMLRDQLVGFRDHLVDVGRKPVATAPGRDVATEYLPWAMLFGLTRRWLRAAGQMAGPGHGLDSLTRAHLARSARCLGWLTVAGDFSANVDD